ncbi:MAG: archaemetzincin family Zn-dependent metalloprotease [Thaumarchaeota archaeon]|nr:archaemetzincin family Zn-dependent metalloprotease [Candidatus Geocrenenecus arthurdayi]MCL7391058.1 archaemetzincin family Zn-dependent metalloprotease [Candidatus Geocrenenecus arthurdayi]MCL7396574.1 archaemetzincin family Zn-dependent metalloprotease [Candidatus Geocrenenecus arthurdayi]
MIKRRIVEFISYSQMKIYRTLLKTRIIPELDDREALETVAMVLRETYNSEVTLEDVRKILDHHSFNSKRKQYDAWKLVQMYGEERRKDEYLLLIVEGDIYASGFNYIFGLAWQGVAVVSTYRLKQEFYGLESNRKIFIQRLMKEAVHEIGHLYGLTHCSDKRCVMAFSNWIGDTDYKSWMLCQNCKSKLNRILPSIV